MFPRAFVVAAFALALVSAPEAKADDAVALIWKGAKDRAAAESLKPGWDRLGKLLAEGGLVVPEGFPTLVESRTVPGLKPGFWVWVVGFCPAGEGGEPLDLLKLVAPDTYSRDVKLPREKLACPNVEAATLKADSHSFKLAEGRVLRVFTYEESQQPEGDEPGDAYTRTQYVFALMGKGGEVLDTVSVVGEETFNGDVRKGPMSYSCQAPDITRDKQGGVKLTRHCSAAIAECGSVVSGDEGTLITVSGSRLKPQELRRTNEERMECGED
ncbi:hypothetical protein ACLESD_30615 [Pyxidicoccus sp. 3LFB2]